MKSQTFEHEMTQTSSVFGRKSSLNVVFKGDGAATDGDNVYLPSIAHDQEVDAETQMVMRGYVDHEAGHNRHSDMPLIMDTYKKWHEENKPVLKGLHNAIEDMWLEKRVMREYGGSEKNLSAVASTCNNSFVEQNSDNPLTQSWASVGPLAVTWEGRRNYEGIEGVDECLDLIPDDLRERVEEWVSRIDDCKNSADCIDLANEIYTNEIEPTMKKKPKPDGEADVSKETTPGKEGEESQDEGEPDTVVGKQPSEDEGTDDGESAATGDGDGEEQEGEGATGGDTEGEEQEGEGSSERGTQEEVDEVTPWTTDLKGGLDAALKAAGLTEHDGKKYRPYTTQYDMVHHRKLDKKHYSNRKMSEGRIAIYQSDLRKLGDTVLVMMRKLSRAFMAKQDRYWEGGREYGRLDSRRLVAAVTGSVNVFKARDEAQEIDTAVMIMVDMSGSMDGSRIVMARQVAIALCNCLDRTTIAYELLGFSTDEHAIPWDEAKNAEAGRFSRISPIRHYIFKAFEEPLRDAKAAIGTMAAHNMHHNVDGESLLFGHERLKKRPENRRIMLVLSDGYPEFNGPDALIGHRKSHLADAVAHVEKEGTEMIGIGIQSTAVSQFYKRYTVVNRLGDLSKGALDQLAKLLIDDKFDVTSDSLIKARKLG